MTTLFIANVGNSDVALDGELVSPPRAAGEDLLKQWSQIAERLSLPILGPVLDHLRDRGQLPDWLILVATDQGESVEERYRSGDTVHTGELARRWLERAYRLTGDRVFLVTTGDRNPSLYDEMCSYFVELLHAPRLKRLQQALAGVTDCVVEPVGGTPAMSAGLLLAAVERFGPRCRVYYLGRQTSRPVELNVGRTFNSLLLRQAATRLLEAYQFAALGPVLLAMGLAAGDCPVALAEYCGRRLNFDFAGAARVADDAVARAFNRPDERRFLIQATAEAEALRKASDPRSLLAELAHSLRVLYQNGAYLDYLARLVRFEESAARFVVESCLPPLSYRDNDAAAQATRRDRIAEWPDLLAYLAEIRVGGAPLRYEVSNTSTLLALVDYVVEDRPGKPPEWRLAPERQAELSEARQVLRRLEGLNRLRNQSVHQFGGASAEEIRAAYARAAGAERDLGADVERALALLGGPGAARWLVDEARDRIRAALWQ